MKKTIRHLASEILDQVNKSQAFAGALLDDYLDTNELSGTADGRLLTHLVYGALRFQGHLDWIGTKLYRGDWEKLDYRIKNILRIAFFQLKFSERLPAFAVVDEAVKVAKKVSPAAGGLVNALLRNYLRKGENISFPSKEKNPAEYIAAFHSHPLWLVKKIIGLLGVNDTEILCAANNDLPSLTLRVNTLKFSRQECYDELTAAGWDNTATKFSPDGLILHNSPQPIQKTNFFRDGYLRLQDEASQLISYLVNPRSGETILDACAGTGGKTTHLAALMKNKGKIVAADYDLKKIAELQADATRQGIKIIETLQADLAVGLPESLKEKFDYVLVDAPCSGSGTLRRNPEIKWRLSPRELKSLAATQNAILQNTSVAVKKGGRLIYSTCSLLREENEDIVNNFLSAKSQFFLEPPCATVIRQFIDSKGFFHTYPHKYNMDGFFGVILKRN
jgi:16S rRNA (cytosine967-C5)-methyltransferase